MHHLPTSPVPVRPRRRILVWSEQGKDFLRNPLGLMGVVIILIFGVMALIHPALMKTIWDRGTYHPLVGFDYDAVPHPASPSLTHLLGTDAMGRDVFSQLLFATRTSFGIGLVAGISATLIALFVGVASAHYGGRLDAFLMLLTGAFVLLPPPIILLIVGLLADMNWLMVGLIFGVFAGLGTLAITFKSQALTIRVKPYVEAARIAGGGQWHIIRVHYFPGMLSLMLVTMMFTVSQAVLIEALLSFFGRTQIRMSWGTMIWFAQNTFRLSPVADQWNAVLPPALAIMFFCGAFYMVGRALDGVVNPRLRKRW